MGHIGIFLGFSVAFLGLAFVILTLLVAQNKRTIVRALGIALILIPGGFFLVLGGGVNVIDVPMRAPVTAIMLLVGLAGITLAATSPVQHREEKECEIN
jgi:hypothetical protein